MISSNLKRLAIVVLAGGALFIGTAVEAEVKKDLSSPKAALTTLAHAMDQGDKDVAKSAVSGDERQMKAIEGMVEMVKGMKDLQTAAKEKYGQIPSELEQEGMEKMIAQVGEATVKEDGDTAVVTMPEEKRPEGMPEPTAEEAAASLKARELKMTRVNGEWKLDAVSMMQGQELTDQQLQQFGVMSKVASETAKEIKDGKYPTYQDAMQALGQKMMAAMMGAAMEEMPQEGNAPAPAPTPAPAPAPTPDAAE